MRAVTTICAAVMMLLGLIRVAAADEKVRSLCTISYPSDARSQWQCLKLKPAVLGGAPRRPYG